MRARVLAVTILMLAAVSVFGDERPEATVLCYHIVESPQDDRMEISRETFRQHLQYLEMTGYNVIPLKHLYEYVSGKRDSIPSNSVVITIDDGWTSAYTEAYPELMKRGMPFTLFIYPNIIGKTSLALTWDQIREMSDAGVDIQSHTFSHPFLTRGRHPEFDDLKYAGWLYRELAESKRVIEQKTGKDVEFLAYPYGDYDTRVARMAGEAGYLAALTCNFGRVKVGSDPLRMKRFVIDKKMTFADFRSYLGAEDIQLAEVSPRGEAREPAKIVTARIPNHEKLDPTSVGLAVLSLNDIAPYSYDPATGSVSLVINEPAERLRGKSHRALVWGVDARTGKRFEASWTFRFAEPEPEPPAPSVAAARMPALSGGPVSANERR